MSPPCGVCAAGVSRDEDVEPGAAARATDSAFGRRRRQPGLRVRAEGRTVHQHLPPVRLSQHQHEGKVDRKNLEKTLDFNFFRVVCALVFIIS